MARSVYMCADDGAVTVVGKCRVEGLFSHSTNDEGLICMDQTVIMCDFAIFLHYN